MEGETKRLTTNIPKALLDRIMSRAEALWGTNNSESNVVAGVLRDWLSQSERGFLDARLDQMERRVEYLLTTRPDDGFREDRPSLADSQIRRRLGLKDAETPGVANLPKKPSPKDVRAFVEGMKREKRKDGLDQFGYIPPEYLLGYDESGEIDYTEYERLGFPLLRDPGRYSMDDPEMRKFVESCWGHPSLIHTPILIYYYGGNFVVLDGLARFAAVVAAWKNGVSNQKRIPFHRLFGEERLARKEMIMRNLHGGPRSLTRAEFERAVDRSNGWE